VKVLILDHFFQPCNLQPFGTTVWWENCMPHHNRQDSPGSWHHVMNRGIARRPVFETRRDIRFFLSRLAWAVRRYELELHAYSVLNTHFHLLVRSVKGNLSSAIGWAENQYVRWFNRSRRRDGSLFRGRFTSLVVSTDTYWHVLVRYIDSNAVSAGLAERPSEYPFCSARHYRRPQGPPWLARKAVEEAVCAARGLGTYDPRAYDDVFPPDCHPSVQWLVKRRLQMPEAREDPLDGLLGLPTARVRDWMRRKAALADGSSPGIPLVDPTTLLSVAGKLERCEPAWVVRRGRSEQPGWPRLRVGLLRDTCALRIQEIANRLRMSPSSVHRCNRENRLLLESDARYRDRAAQVLTQSLKATFG
jgi:REP element-mobilizing transposase RayT